MKSAIRILFVVCTLGANLGAGCKGKCVFPGGPEVSCEGAECGVCGVHGCICAGVP